VFDIQCVLILTYLGLNFTCLIIDVKLKFKNFTNRPITLHAKDTALFGLVSSSKICYHKEKNNNSKILKLSLPSQTDSSRMESRILCLNAGMSVEWQTLPATRKTEIGSLERGIKRIIAKESMKKGQYKYSEGYVF